MGAVPGARRPCVIVGSAREGALVAMALGHTYCEPGVLLMSLVSRILLASDNHNLHKLVSPAVTAPTHAHPGCWPHPLMPTLGVQLAPLVLRSLLASPPPNLHKLVSRAGAALTYTNPVCFTGAPSHENPDCQGYLHSSQTRLACRGRAHLYSAV